MLCILRQLFIHGYSRCSSQWKTEGAAISNLLCYRNNCLHYIKAKLQCMQFMHRATFWPICLGLEMVSEVSKVGQRCSNFWSFTNKNNGFHLRMFIKSQNPTVWHGIYNLLFAMYVYYHYRESEGRRNYCNCSLKVHFVLGFQHS